MILLIFWNAGNRSHPHLPYDLGQNYPNPFTGSTRFDYELLSGVDVRIDIMDLTGRKIRSLSEGYRPAGRHSVELDAAGLEPGIYIYTLTAGSFRDTRQMVVY